MTAGQQITSLLQQAQEAGQRLLCQIGEARLRRALEAGQEQAGPSSGGSVSVSSSAQQGSASARCQPKTGSHDAPAASGAGVPHGSSQEAAGGQAATGQLPVAAGLLQHEKTLVSQLVVLTSSLLAAREPLQQQHSASGSTCASSGSAASGGGIGGCGVAAALQPQPLQENEQAYLQGVLRILQSCATLQGMPRCGLVDEGERCTGWPVTLRSLLCCWCCCLAICFAV